MIAIPNDQPVLTVSEAARASGVERRTIRRRLDDGEFPNAYRDAGSQGPGSGAWLIPVEDLERAGLTLGTPIGPGASIPSSDGPSDQEALQSALADALRRAEVAEATAAERQRVIEAQELALRAFAAAVELKEAVPLDVIAPQDDPSDGLEPDASEEPAEPEASGPEMTGDQSDPEVSGSGHHPDALAEPGRPEELEPEESEPEESEPEESEPEELESEAPEAEALAERGQPEEPESEEPKPAVSAGRPNPEASARPVPAILPGAPSRPTPPWVSVSTPPLQRRWWQRRYR